MSNDDLKFSISAQDAELIAQALDVYGTTLMCAPLGLGLELLVSVRALRERLGEATQSHVKLLEAVDDSQGNVVMFARA